MVRDPEAPRSVIDYALNRRAALRQLFGGGGLSSEFCDADPYLLRAARFHGEPAGHPCPACRGPNLSHVRYAYGDALGHISGGAFRSSDLSRLARAHESFRVYVVEVCARCSWNFLIEVYTLGDGVPRRPLPRPRDLMES